MGQQEPPEVHQGKEEQFQAQGWTGHPTRKQLFREGSGDPGKYQIKREPVVCPLAKRADGVLGCIKQSISIRLSISPLFSTRDVASMLCQTVLDLAFYSLAFAIIHLF